MCGPTVHLCKLVLPEMVARDQGRIPIHLFDRIDDARRLPGVYNASKSFVQSFAPALRNELKETGVTVTSLMPGPTETEFFERADMEDTKVGSSEKDEVGRGGTAGLRGAYDRQGRGRRGLVQKQVQVAASRLMPDAAKAAMHRRMAEPGSGERR